MDLSVKSLRKPYQRVSFSNLERKALIVKEDSGDIVYEVVDRLTSATYALREFSGLYDSSDRAKISREVQVMKKLDHPNLVRCHEMFDIGDRIYLLLEHMDSGSLVGGDISSESDLASVAYQVLSGLSYLHRNKISHGDIRPSNFFVNSMKQVKVLYLGKILSKTAVVVKGIEAIHDEFSWDVWNVGLSFLKLCKGSNWGLRDHDFAKIFKSEVGPYSSRDLGAPMRKPSLELWDFLLCCMQTDFLERLTPEELVHHPFVKQRTSSLDEMLTDVIEDRGMEDIEESDVEDKESIFDDDETYTGVVVAPEATLSHGEEEQISPKNKKPRICTEDKDSIYNVGGSKDPRQMVSQAQNNTSDYLERCIQHCSLFHPDDEFEKDKLVQLWIAEECIEVEGTQRLEDVASKYFDTLVHQDVIIPSKFDYRQLRYKVNTSKSSTWFHKSGKYLRIEEGNLDEICTTEALHLTWHCKRLDWSMSDALKNFKQLRTLLVHEDCGAMIKQLPSDIFSGLKLLRTLDLSHTHISELPFFIGTLESLRCLDISETPIKRLPESTDCLYFLQTLKLRGCSDLFALPRGLGRLINLRHLDFDIVSQLKSMPRWMGSLTKLQTLQAFLVGKNDGCGIGELKNMNDITGSFCVSRLDNVANAEEAKEAALANKERIVKLELRWSGHRNNKFQDEILECLQPHFNLRELQISFFTGTKLPSWLSNPSFTDLASITLYNCINCHMLPSIGELPSLRILHIICMESVRDINALFCRSHGARGFEAFPRLEKLILDGMLNLEEWAAIEDGDFPCLCHISIRYCPKLSVLPSMSNLCSLQHLELSDCAQLISLPEGILPSSLETLIIRDCPKLNEQCLQDGGQDRFKIAHVKNICFDLQEISLD